MNRRSASQAIIDGHDRAYVNRSLCSRVRRPGNKPDQFEWMSADSGRIICEGNIASKSLVTIAYG
jgi:hypothetical protein